MLSTVLKDKEKIEETIEELDRYKRDALQKTWEKVNGFVKLIRTRFFDIFAEKTRLIVVTLAASSRSYYQATLRNSSLQKDKI
jgi:chromosome segregation ATPase